jgi:recombination associated protein RdgC
MWFSNLIVYKFKQPANYNTEEFEAALAQDVIRKPGERELSTFGWGKALGKHGETLAHFCKDHILVCAKTITKNIPASVVNELLAEKVEAIETTENRPVKKKEKDELKENILIEMMKDAYTKTTRTHAFIDMKNGLLVVNAGSFNKAEELLALLRKSLGSLPVVPAFLNIDLDALLTTWLTSYETPDGFAIGGDAHLEEPCDSGQNVKLAGHDLACDEVKAHLESGKRVTLLRLDWQKRLKFTLKTEGSIKRITYCDTLKEENADIPKEEMRQKLDADFFLASSEIVQLLLELLIGCGDDSFSEVKSERLKQDLVDNLHTDAVDDPLYSEAVIFVVENNKPSVSALQRKFRIGYNRSARLIEEMVKAGIVSAPGHNGAREVLAK